MTIKSLNFQLHQKNLWNSKYEIFWTLKNVDNFFFQNGYKVPIMIRITKKEVCQQIKLRFENSTEKVMVHKCRFVI